MPELPVKEVRLSELHLPEINRDEIVRSLSEVRLPTVELPRVERPRIAIPEAIGRIDWRSIDVSGALAGVAAIARLGRPIARRSRWPLAAGAVIVVAGIAAVAVIASRPALRERAGRTVHDLRARIDAATGTGDRLEIEEDVTAAANMREPIATVATAADVAAETENPAASSPVVADVEEAGSPA
jgi:hypothetical protein